MKFVRAFKKQIKASLPAATTLLFAMGGVAIASAGGGHGAAEPKGWVITDTYKVLNFIVLAGALFYIAKKPVADFFTSRVSSIREQLADLEKKKEAAQKALAEYEAKLADLEGESARIVEEYVKQGEAAKGRILAEAEAQAAKLEENAKRNIDQEIKAAKAKLQKDIAGKALEQAEALVKASITSEDQDRLVDDYLGKVVAS